MRGWLGIAAVGSALLLVPAVAVGHTDAGMHGDPFRMAAAADPPATGRLAEKWCGDVTTTEDIVHETGNRELPKIKAVAAYPRDVELDPERGDFIQAQLMRTFDHVASESGGRRSLRFDLGTRCGPQYVDVLTVRLPDTAAKYLEGCPGPLFTQIRDLLPEPEGPRNYIVFTPDLPCREYAGIANLPRDDQPGPANAANRGNWVAFTNVADWTVALHEMGHNLGAVQDSAPHVDPNGGHCFDGRDIMCYIGLSPAPLSAPALEICRVDPEPFDCNRDDYFNPAPAPGSYLATHWNLFNSVFLCDLPTCTPTSTSPVPGTPVAAGLAPAVTADPRLKVTRAARAAMPRRPGCRRAGKPRKAAKRCARRARSRR